VKLGNLATYILDIGRLVALATMGYGGEVGAVGLEEQKLGGELGNYPI
jgi:hypothetical protein